KSCAITARRMTLAFELNIIIGAPLGGLCAWPDSPTLPRATVLAQAVGVYSDLAVVAPDFEQIVESRRGFRTGVDRRTKRSGSNDVYSTPGMQVPDDIGAVFMHMAVQTELHLL